MGYYIPGLEGCISSSVFDLTLEVARVLFHISTIHPHKSSSHITIYSHPLHYSIEGFWKCSNHKKRNISNHRVSKTIHVVFGHLYETSKNFETILTKHLYSMAQNIMVQDLMMSHDSIFGHKDISN